MAALLLTAILPAGAALAAKPINSCPAGVSGFERVTSEEWWARTVAGFEEEGIDVYEDDGVTFTEEFDEFVMALGFEDGQALYEYIVGPQWDALNKNGNSYVCAKSGPDVPGIPAYFINGIDDQAAIG
jgi:hypothetical protein